MSSTVPAAPPPFVRPRSWLVTGLAWMIIVRSAVLTPISAISLAMILVRSYGTSTSDPLGFVLVVAGILAFNAYGLFRPPRPEFVHVSAGGVKTTTLASTGTYSIPAFVLAALALALLLTPRVAAEFGAGRKP